MWYEDPILFSIVIFLISIGIFFLKQCMIQQKDKKCSKRNPIKRELEENTVELIERLEFLGIQREIVIFHLRHKPKPPLSGAKSNRNLRKSRTNPEKPSQTLHSV